MRRFPSAPKGFKRSGTAPMQFAHASAKHGRRILPRRATDRKKCAQIAGIARERVRELPGAGNEFYCLEATK